MTLFLILMSNRCNSVLQCSVRRPSYRRLAASTLKLLLRNLMRSRTRKLLTINKSNMYACCVFINIYKSKAYAAPLEPKWWRSSGGHVNYHALDSPKDWTLSLSDSQILRPDSQTLRASESQTLRVGI